MFTGKPTEDFWFIYNALELKEQYLPIKEFYKFNFPYSKNSPFLYFINAKAGKVILMHEITKDEGQFISILNFILTYSKR
ncbi:MAG: hypothetical protein D6715_02525 [Calditrichaeota bacterium]|nr:MAG: hypothetical protein D6715_02525 [Calditrichota bacterium]